MKLDAITQEDYRHLQYLATLLARKQNLNEDTALDYLEDFVTSPNPDMITTLFVWQALDLPEFNSSSIPLLKMKENARNQFRSLHQFPLLN